MPRGVAYLRCEKDGWTDDSEVQAPFANTVCSCAPNAGEVRLARQCSRNRGWLAWHRMEHPADRGRRLAASGLPERCS